MARKNRKRQYRRQGKSLISSGKINPQAWHLTEQEICQALEAQGIDVSRLKKIRYLKHQACISWWDKDDNVCSSFFSYRIFARWQAEVERLIYTCPSLKELYKLMGNIQYELDYFPYPVEMADAIAAAVENYRYHLSAAIPQAELLLLRLSLEPNAIAPLTSARSS